MWRSEWQEECPGSSAALRARLKATCAVMWGIGPPSLAVKRPGWTPIASAQSSPARGDWSSLQTPSPAPGRTQQARERRPVAWLRNADASHESLCNRGNSALRQRA